MRAARALLALLALAAAGCFSAGFGRASDLVSDAWALYAEGRFDDALALFQAAAGAAGGDVTARARARNGEGWCRLRLHAPVDALADFDAAVAGGADGADALAGRAGARLAAGLDAGARADARAARALEPSYVSFHDPLDARSLGGVALVASIRAGDLAGAQEELDLLAPGNGLSPGDPSSWVVDGAPLPSYASAVLSLAAANDR